MEDIIELYIGKENVKTIVEAGACDCADSVKMTQEYPNATVYAFECNPETIPLCLKAEKESNGRIYFVPTPLWDKNEMGEFHPIDTKKTVTTHVNGNPGASSFFMANPEYPTEKYVQDIHFLRTLRFDDSGAPTPELLWLDAQGAELKILKGFGDKLKDVKVIKTEVLFKEQYLGAPLFEEVEEWLDEHGFRFVRFLEMYEWFGDAVFVNKNL